MQNLALKILKVENPAEKIRLLLELKNDILQENKKSEIIANVSQEWSIEDLPKHPSYQSLCKVVAKDELPKRNNLNSEAGFSSLIHSIAHIEYSAIDLALESILVAANSLDKLLLNEKYYYDWLEVAWQEAQHFNLLDSLLKIRGVKYGDLEVHDDLFTSSRKCKNLLSRMAIVPRYLEALGLDANPKVRQKVFHCQNKHKKELVDALDIIMQEEVDHVKKGDFWFKHLVYAKGLNLDIFFNLVREVFPNGGEKLRSVNEKARILAGYSIEEIQILQGGEARREIIDLILI